MKKPEDKLESLYQEQLGDQKHPVSDRVWQRVQERTKKGPDRGGPLFWWSLSGLLLLILAASGWWLSEGATFGSEEDQKERSEEKSIVEERTASDRAQSKSDNERKDREEDRAGADERSEKDAEEGEKEKGSRKERSEDRDDPAKSTEESKDRSASGNEVGAPGQEHPAQTQGSEKKDDPREDREKELDASTANDDGSPGRTEDVRNEEETLGSTDDRAEDEAEGTSPSEESEHTGAKKETRALAKDASEKEKGDPQGLPTSKKQDEKGSDTKREKRNERLKLMERRVPEASDVEFSEADSMGKEPEKIELSKGDQAISDFYIRGRIAYGPSFRSLEDLRGRGLADHRDQNESSINSFSYGIEGGVRWSNGFGAGLGVERNLFGSDLSLQGSETLTDSTFSTDTTWNYIDSTYIDSNTGDTITVIIDSNQTGVNNDTSVSKRDSSYERTYSIRYRYVTVPITFSYRFKLHDRFTLVPTIGFGLNFLTRAKAGWSPPDSDEEVRLRHPQDPPFRRFALSFKGRLAVQYEFAESWRVGAGFRYSRFLHSVYTDEIGLDERPYSYGGNLSVTYLLGN